jgi:beta-glucosidase
MTHPIKFSLIFTLLIFTFLISGESDQSFPFEDPDLTIEERVDDLVSRMTLEEKVSQLVYDAPAIDRLHIPQYNWWNECLHGVARAGLATVFPQAIGLAASWDTELMYRVATAISDEARAKHHEFVRRGKRDIYQGLTFWSPNINIFRDPRWGRGMETYGEDPFLTGRMAVAFIKGLQGNDPKYLKVVATAKHYAVHSGPEPARHTFDAVTDERDLRETYLPHFLVSVKEASVQSIMCAYNRYLGEACCGSNKLLVDILRSKWGFAGYLVSDCGAVRDIYENHQIVPTAPEAAALALKAGCDLNCGRVYPSLLLAVQQNLASEAEIDTAVKRLFRARFKLGMFDPEDRVSYSRIPYEVVNSEAHQQLALEAALKSIVLLKNQNNLLPLSKHLKKIAVIGPNADDVEVLLGNYNGIPADPVTPLRGIRKIVSPETEILYSLGCEWAENMPVLEPVPVSAFQYLENGHVHSGLKAEYFDNNEFQGEPLFTRIDSSINFNWWDGAPVPEMNDDNFAVRWNGCIIPPISGSYILGGESLNLFKIYLADSLLVQFDGRHHSRKVYKSIQLESGEKYPLKVEFSEYAGDAFMQFLWSQPHPYLEKEAIKTAKKAEVVILVMGLSPRLEGEEMEVEVKGFYGGDRLTLDLPDVQIHLMQEIQKTGRPTVLVLLNGSAVSINWADDNLPAIIEAWYPGQAAGAAIAEVLFGDYNPAGRLPVTFYQSVEQLPAFSDYSMTSRTYRYFSGQPLYPFGYGLSYTRFKYSNLVIPSELMAGSEVTVSVEVENIGKFSGEEVVQLYISDEEASVKVPIRSLAGFQRISLAPGEKKQLTFRLTPRQFSLIDSEYKRMVEPGEFLISVGGIQPGFKSTSDSYTTEVLTTRIKITGEPFYLEEF